ncbi:MAG: 4-hydroxy-tetrahydrodipicolinate synthase [Candidatus Diapherotrites archaeon]|nr:4-hydroxy-tetrahydrodipicolinate synthase [Candidatus Diapherotrites archaeon]
MKKYIQGSFVALVTPMKEDGNRLNHAIDFDAFGELIDHIVKAGINGIVPCGCTGHAATLTVEEQIKLIRFARERTPEKVKVIAGDGSNCTREAIDLAKKIEDIGINTHMQISPYQNKPTQEGLYQHYATIAKAIPGDIILYNVPGRTGKNIEPETTLRLAKDFDNIIGIKEASGNMDQIKKIIHGSQDSKFSVISGDDGLALQIIKESGTGCISVAGNVDPVRVAKYIQLGLEHKYTEAEKIEKELKELFRVLFIESNPCPAHYALKKLGIQAGTPRLPLVEVTDKTKHEIDLVLKDLGLLK